jgi:hypothetical protein
MTPAMTPERNPPQENLPSREPKRSAHMHPVVYWGMAGSVAWFVAAAWISLGGSGYVGLLLAVVTGFFVIAAAIPFTLWLTWHRHQPASAHAAAPSFRDWAAGELELSQERRPAISAAIEALLPMAAAAVGMTDFGLIFHYAAAAASG